MAKKDLIPLNKRSKEEALKIQRKGGATKSPQKKRAAKEREIKKRMLAGTVTEADEAYILTLVEDPNVMAGELLHYLKKISQEIEERDFNSSGDDKPLTYLKVQLASLVNQVFKSIHGERVKIQSTNVNLNLDVNTSIEEAYKMRQAMKQEKQKNEN